MRDTTITKIEDLDAADAAFVAGYTAIRNGCIDPQLGDFVRFLDGHLARIIRNSGETIGTDWNDSSRFCITEGHGLSFSGSSGQSVPRDLLLLTSEIRPGEFWFFSHQGAPWDKSFTVEIPCKLYVQVEGISRLMGWTSCNNTYSSIHGYQVTERQNWTAHFESEFDSEGVPKIIPIGEFDNPFRAEEACERHCAAQQGKRVPMYWSRYRRARRSRHNYFIYQMPSWWTAELESDGKRIPIGGEFSYCGEAEKACELHHLGELGLGEEEIKAAFAERYARQREADLAWQAEQAARRRESAKKAAETRARRQEKKIYKIIEQLSLGHKYGPATQCVVCSKELSDPESIERAIGSDCWQEILQRIEREKDRDS